MRGNMDLRRVVSVVACAVLVASGCAKEDEPAFAPTTVVSLYDARVKSVTPGGLGLLVAEVGIGPKGAKLMNAPDAEVAGALNAALADLSTRPFLPAMEEGPDEGGTTMSIGEIKPGDEKYAWAVGGFLRERTGLRYDVRPYSKSKTP
jgi:hypothetical protein